MNETEFRERWYAEKSMYEAWGRLIVDSVSSSLSLCLNVNLKEFLKIPAEHRIKEDNSLLDKAFYRNKGYKDPYNDIEDKVGVRFVVMLQSDAEKVCEVIMHVADTMDWEALQCRNYNEERISAPTLFTYQSHHFIIRNRQPIIENGVTINKGTPCEVQVRSLLQHAYAELTHNAIYKKKTLVEPEVARTVAKTMAFIETADEFFLDVIKKTGPNETSDIESFLDCIFIKIIGNKPIKMNSTIIILDTFKYLIEDNFEADVLNFIKRNSHICKIIKMKSLENNFYMQSVIIFVYWLIRRKKSAVEANWPLDWKIISSMAMDVGVALDRMC